MPPKYQACYVCGREFGSQSLAIHQKNCLQKREKEQATLPPNLRTNLTYDPSSGEQPSDAWKRSLSPCPNCGRTFLPDRLEVHLRSCKGSAPTNMRPPSSGNSQYVSPTSKQPQLQYDPRSARAGQRDSGYNIISHTEMGGNTRQQQSYQSKYFQPQTQTQDVVSRSDNSRVVKQPTQQQRQPTTSAPAKRAGGRGVPFAVDIGPTVPCSICGRSFAEDRIEKHEGICRTASQKRKVFDSSKARKKGTELEGFRTKGGAGGAAGASRVPSSRSAPIRGKQSKWRVEHEEFIRNVRAARKITHIQKVGGAQALANLPPPPPSANLDYITCPHCLRRFNETAGERHIPKCKTTINRPKPPPGRSAPPPAYPPARAKATPTKPAMKTMPTSSSSAYGRGIGNGGDDWSDASAYPVASSSRSQYDPYPPSSSSSSTAQYKGSSTGIRQPTPTKPRTATSGSSGGYGVPVASAPTKKTTTSSTASTLPYDDSGNMYGIPNTKRSSINITAPTTDNMYGGGGGSGGSASRTTTAVARKNSVGNYVDSMYGVITQQQHATTAVNAVRVQASGSGASQKSGYSGGPYAVGGGGGGGGYTDGGYSKYVDVGGGGYSGDYYDATYVVPPLSPSGNAMRRKSSAASVGGKMANEAGYANRGGGGGNSNSNNSNNNSNNSVVVGGGGRGQTNAPPTKTISGGGGGGGGGVKLPRFCGHCGTLFNERAKFCMECGGPR